MARPTSAAAAAWLLLLLLLSFWISSSDAFSSSVVARWRNSQCLTATTSTTTTAEADASVALVTAANGFSEHHDYQFTTLPMPLYIEDTDAYGVKYNANYLRTYERALHQAQLLSSSSESDFPPDFDTDWSITAVDHMKLKQAPSLGQLYVVRGVLVEATSMCLKWNLSMTSPDGTTIYSTADGVTIQSLLKHPVISSLATEDTMVSSLSSASSSPSTSSQHHTDTFITYRDEFDPHSPQHLPLFCILKLMERARSNWIGGPDALRQMQTDDKIVYVVTAFQDLQLLPSAFPERRITPGKCPVTIQTEFVAKKNGMVVDCLQTAYPTVAAEDDFDDENGQQQQQPMAQARVTIMALNSQTWRPTKKLPAWFLEKLGLS